MKNCRLLSTFLDVSSGHFKTVCAACALSVVFGQTVQAGDFVLGIGQDNIDSKGTSEAVSVQLEYQFDPIRSYTWGAVSPIGVIGYDDDNDLYIGAGMALIWNTSENWFVEGSLAAGYYDAGSNGKDLGGDFQFRTLLGFGYRVTDNSRVSLALDHISNAGIYDENPGRNALMLRYARSF